MYEFSGHTHYQIEESDGDYIEGNGQSDFSTDGREVAALGITLVPRAFIDSDRLEACSV